MDKYERLKIAPLEAKMSENHLRWFGHLQSRPLSAPVTKCDDINIDQGRGRGRPKPTWIFIIQKDMMNCGLCDDLEFDPNKWRKIIHVVEPK